MAANEYDRVYNGKEPAPAYISKLSNKSKFTPRCDHYLDVEAENLAGQIKSTVFHSCCQSLSSWKRYGSRSRDYEIIQMAKRQIRSSGFRILRNDKDGGFCLARDGEVSGLQNSLLNNGNYETVEVDAFDFDRCYSDYRDICSDVAEGHKLSEDLLKHLTVDTLKKSTLVSILDMNIKSHKDPGAVVPRPIHSSVDHAFSGGMRYIAYLVRLRLSSCEHLTRDSDDFIKKIARLKVDSGTYLVKIDVKEFFMSGEIQELVSFVKHAFSDRGRVPLTKLADHILKHQYIRTGKSRQLHRVIKGSGMGLIFSGEVSDFVLYCLLELSFLLVPSVQAKFRISGVFRFKDDLMLFVDGPRWSIDALIRVMQVKSKFFKLKLESCCTNSARFLDLEISKGPHWRTTGCLDYQVVVKQSHLGIVLDDSSSHPNSVHSTWPISIFNRIAFRSSSLAVCKASQDSFCGEV